MRKGTTGFPQKRRSKEKTGAMALAALAGMLALGGCSSMSSAMSGLWKSSPAQKQERAQAQNMSAQAQTDMELNQRIALAADSIDRSLKSIERIERGGVLAPAETAKAQNAASVAVESSKKAMGAARSAEAPPAAMPAPVAAPSQVANSPMAPTAEDGDLLEARVKVSWKGSGEEFFKAFANSLGMNYRQAGTAKVNWQINLRFDGAEGGTVRRVLEEAARQSDRYADVLYSRQGKGSLTLTVK